ncbi:dihydropteroate synthase [candidate division WOR-3 bacterium]|nr:dihydropteroate synthase [candidate division WOR-3 bacterium]
MKACVISLDNRDEVYGVFERIGVDREAWDLMWRKSEIVCIFIDDLSMAGGNVLKQAALSSGAEAAVAGGVINGTSLRTKVLIMGTRSQLHVIAEKIKIQQFHLSELSEKIRKILSSHDRLVSDFVWKMSEKEIVLDKPRIIGIINVTPDSFYEQSRKFESEKAVELALEMIDQGADMLDVGGESTRPGSERVSPEQEFARVFPVISALRKITDLPISIDTVHPSTAQKALKEGCDAVNDVSGLENEEMMRTVLENSCGVVLMHKKGDPYTMQENPHYENVFEEVRDYLDRQQEKALSFGIMKEKIVFDPGIGFGKTFKHNLSLLKSLKDLGEYLERPVYIGLSRKSLIGALGGGQTPAERLSGTLSLSTLALMQGVRLFRTHDVEQTKKALDVAYGAIKEGR